MESLIKPDIVGEPAGGRPRLGFLGTGWIGRNRLEAIVGSGLAEAAVIADADEAMAEHARRSAPGSLLAADLDEMLDAKLDGIVIATPSALHAEQAIRALDAGMAVFCQKPLGRNRDEVERVVAAARRADRLLGVDFSYRFTAGVQAIAGHLEAGTIGPVFAAELEFHNGYGPGKPWFYDKRLAGGGCVMDLGIHLADLALWLMGPACVTRVESVLYKNGRRLPAGTQEVEDFAAATLAFEGGATARIACSWKLHLGADVLLRVRFFGGKGGLEFANVGGSFYDFTALHHHRTTSDVLSRPPDDWGGRAAIDWARRLARSPAYDPACETYIAAADILDRIYSPDD